MASNSEKLYLKKILSSYLLKIEQMFKRKLKMGLEELMNKLASSHLGPGGKESHQYIPIYPQTQCFVLLGLISMALFIRFDFAVDGA